VLFILLAMMKLFIRHFYILWTVEIKPTFAVIRLFVVVVY